MFRKLLLVAAAAGMIAWLAKNKDTAKGYLDRYGGKLKSAAPDVGAEPVDERLNDPALAQKVESEVFRDDTLPKGSISVNAEYGVIYFRGEVPSRELMDELTTRARAVDGVRAVENLTHLPGEPAQTA
jgi:osmotically-inducible protein OsmY